MATKKVENIAGKQSFRWVLLAEIEMAPAAWGRPLRMGDVRAIAAGFDPDMVGAVALWYRPQLEASRGRYVCIDGQHRCAALRLLKYDDQRVPSLLYEGLTMETAAELSLGLQDRRNLHALDKHRAALAAHERRAVEVDKILTYCSLEFGYHSKATDIGRLSAVGTVYAVWDRMGAQLERVLTVCSRAWGGTSAGFAQPVLKLVTTVMAAHNGDVDDRHLAETLSARSPAQWTSREVVPRRSTASLAQDVIIEYNKKARGGNRLSELTHSQYEQAVRRPPSPTVRGKLDVPQTATNQARRMRRRVKESNQMPYDPYEDPDINTGEDGFPDSVTFDRVGDGVRGRVLLIEKSTSRYGPALKYTLFGRGRGPSNTMGEDRQLTMLARAKNLKAQMLSHKPQAGDVVDVQLIELRDTAQGTAKLFDVEVTPGDGQQLAPPPKPAQSAPVAPRVVDVDGPDLFDR